MENDEQGKILPGNSASSANAGTESRSQRPVTNSVGTQTSYDGVGQMMDSELDLPKESVHGVDIIDVVREKISDLRESMRSHTNFLAQLRGENVNRNVQPQPPVMQDHIERPASSAQRNSMPQQQNRSPTRRKHQY